MLRKAPVKVKQFWSKWWGPRFSSPSQRFSWMIAIAGIAVLLICASGALWAYLTAQSEVEHNQFRIALQTIEIDEEFEPSPNENGWVKKRVRFTNTGDCPCYVRALILASIEDERIRYDFDSESWSEPDEDGWRYCSLVIEPKESTPYVLEGLTTELHKSFDVYVVGESIQAEGFASPQQAFAALRGSDRDE